MSAGIRTTATAARKLAFVYDYMGRRVKKAVYADNSLIYETLFVYEGWNLIEEITRRGDTESSRYFVWGLDLSQSLQGAGGIGGLLSMADANASYHYLYDANGNVSQLVNAATGEISAHYEYDPFGNLTAKSGVYADANPFRFSTKYFDRETGLYDFGLRDYLPELGRWTSRDPIEEEGGVNLYASFSNNPANYIDILGTQILSFQIKNNGESEVYKFDSSLWKNDLELMYKDIGGKSNLGLHVGKGYEPTFISEFCRLYGWCKNEGKKRAIGLYKFEIRVDWCGSTKNTDWPHLLHYISKLKVWKMNKQSKEISIIVDEASERQDGVINQIVGISDGLKNVNGTYKAIAYDAPRFSSMEFHNPAQYGYYFEAEWRITAEDTDSLWEAKIRLEYSFDNNGDPYKAKSSFSIISDPKRVK